MQKNRLARLASVIRQEVAMIVSREVNDPRIPSVTFTHVEVVDDGSQATLSVMILGGKTSERQMSECLKGLESSAGFLRRHLAKILTIRHIPTLLFKEDKGLDNVLRVNELLKEIGPLPKDEPTKDPSDSSSGHGDTV